MSRKLQYSISLKRTLPTAITFHHLTTASNWSCCKECEYLQYITFPIDMTTTLKWGYEMKKDRWIFHIFINSWTWSIKLKTYCRLIVYQSHYAMIIDEFYFQYVIKHYEHFKNDKSVYYSESLGNNQKTVLEPLS